MSRVIRALACAVAAGLAVAAVFLATAGKIPFGGAAGAVVCAALACFFLLGENARLDERKIVAVAVMTAAAAAGRAAFYFAPGFKPIVAVVLLCGASLGAGAGFLCGALSMLLSNFFFGQGPWTAFQMLGMGAVGFLSGGLRPFARTPVLAVWGAVASYIYCAIADIWTLMSLGTAASWKGYLVVAAAGVPAATALAASTVLFTVILGVPLLGKLNRLRKRFGLGGREAARDIADIPGKPQPGL